MAENKIQKTDLRPRTPIFLVILFVLTLIAGVFWGFGGYSLEVFKNPIVWVVMALTVVLLVVVNSLNKLIDNQLFSKASESEKKRYLEQLELPLFTRALGGAYQKQSDEEEQEIILDHGFDGIVELDNSLPKWWISLFYFGVAYCVIYIISFFTSDFSHPLAKLEKDTQEHLAMVEEIERIMPQPTIESATYQDDKISEGKVLFEKNCASCHKANGAGGIGPNLTDDHWINIKQEDLFKNVFYMVQYGSENNPAMRAFGERGELKGRSIEKIASFVYDINQNKPDAPDGAAPAGEKVDWEAGVTLN